MTMRTYVWKAADLSRAWDQLTDFAKDVTTYINQQRVTADIADGAVTPAKLTSIPFLSLYRSAAISVPNGGVASVVPMTIQERSSGQDSPAFDATNGRAIVRRDGLYRVSVLVHCTPTAAAAAGSVIAVAANVDGAEAFIGSVSAVLNAGVTVYAEKTIRLLKSQAVELRCYRNTGAAQALTVTPTDRVPRLQIEYVGGL